MKWTLDNIDEIEGSLLWYTDWKPGLRKFILILSVNKDAKTYSYIGDSFDYAFCSDKANLETLIQCLNFPEPSWEVHK